MQDIRAFGGIFDAEALKYRDKIMIGHECTDEKTNYFIRAFVALSSLLLV
jgi:hypothetical protein